MILDKDHAFNYLFIYSQYRNYAIVYVMPFVHWRMTHYGFSGAVQRFFLFEGNLGSGYSTVDPMKD